MAAVSTLWERHTLVKAVSRMSPRYSVQLTVTIVNTWNSLPAVVIYAKLIVITEVH